MKCLPCPQGRLQSAALAAMNLRAVIDPTSLTYVSMPPTKPSLVTTLVPARYRPRNPVGQFASYAELKQASDLDYAFTAFEYDELDAQPASDDPAGLETWEDLDWGTDSGEWEDPDDPFDFFDIA